MFSVKLQQFSANSSVCFSYINSWDIFLSALTFHWDFQALSSPLWRPVGHIHSLCCAIRVQSVNRCYSYHKAKNSRNIYNLSNSNTTRFRKKEKHYKIQKKKRFKKIFFSKQKLNRFLGRTFDPCFLRSSVFILII